VANSDTRLSGANAAIYIGGTKVAAKAQWTLNRARDTIDVTSFGDTNKAYVAGLPDISGSFAGFLDTSGDLLLTNAGTSTPISIALWAVDSSTEVAHGSGYVDATVTAGVSDALRITGNFRASGNWSIDM
jgi:hypothetical protein